MYPVAEDAPQLPVAEDAGSALSFVYSIAALTRPAIEISAPILIFVDATFESSLFLLNSPLCSTAW